MRARAPGRARARSSPSPRKIGLALAGGGPLGGIYEVGALLALADSLDGIDFNELDAYVGVSSGSFVAAALANQISPAQMYRLFIDDGIDAALKPEIFLRPALSEYVRRLTALPALALHATLQYLRDPFHRGVLASFSTLSRAVPTGVFDNGAIDEFMAKLFSGAGRTNDFRNLPHTLFLVATNLDTGAPVTFGGRGHDHVSISKAIAASSALPGLFPPVVIDGEHYVDGALNKTLHASVALDQGIDLLLCVNPLVPFDASSARRRGRVEMEKINQGGLPLVLSQTFRAIIHSRLRVGMEKYSQQYPHADVLLFEPDREDADMFFANIFSYSQRRRLCSIAFHKTRDNLLARAGTLAPVLARHGIALRMDRLQDRHRAITRTLTDPRPLLRDPSQSRRVRQTNRDLSHTLDQLERWLVGSR
jgi:predicted acylesterase/phospholipase RssA